MKTLLISLSLLLSLPAMAIKVDQPAPNFDLKNHKGKSIRLSDYKGKYIVLEWLNHGCPYIRKHYDSGNMQSLQKEFTQKGVVWLSIISSAPGKQGYMSPTEIRSRLKKERAYPSHVLIDADGKVGKIYDAKVTPHMYVINPKGNLIYMGAIDDKPTTDTNDIKSATNYVKNALNASMNNKKVKPNITRAYGCAVKY